MKLYNQVIRVFTPEAAGESCFARTTIGTWIVEAVTRPGSTTKFQIETERSYFYFNPVLLGDGTTM